jgi:hypothetical protein
MQRTTGNKGNKGNKEQKAQKHMKHMRDINGIKEDLSSSFVSVGARRVLRGESLVFRGLPANRTSMVERTADNGR